MIKLSTLHHARLSAAALFLAAELAGCGTVRSVPPGPTPPATSATETTGGAPTTPPTAPPTAPANPPTTAPAQPTATPAASAPTTAPSGEDASAAVQTVLDYYAAINQHAYDRAYHLWAQEGAASNQTFDQFQQGFANTVQVSVQFGKASASASAVTVPISITSVVNVPNGPPPGQQVQRFRGTYTVQPGANGWRIASANIAEAGGGPQPPADVGDPLAILQSYYAAINARDFARAYTYWGDNGQASGQTFTQFSQGFATTDHVAIDVGAPQSGGAAGSIFADVPIVIVATQKDGAQQTFCGTYTLRRPNVPPFDQLGWRIDHAAISQTAGVQPGSDQEKRLLANGCKP
jgi:hypothetical protein